MLFTHLQVNTTNTVVDSLQNLQQISPNIPKTGQETALIDIIFSGGIIGQVIMTALLIMLFFSVYCYIERLLAIRSVNKKEDDLMLKIKHLLIESKISEALQFCKSIQSPTARIIEKGIARIGKPIDDIHTAMENTGKIEVYKLEKNVGYLSTLSGAGPMTGFLGTVFGMVLSFKQMADAQNTRVDMSMLSEGVYTAMTSTLVGLIVGLIAYFGYHHISGKIDQFSQQLERNAVDFLELLNENE